MSERIAAYALYTDPPLGRAGMTEAEVAHCLGSPVALRRGRMIDTGSRQLPVLHVSGDNQERE